MKTFQLIVKIQQSSLMNLPRRFSFSVRSFVAREPSYWFLYQFYIWWGQIKKKAINANPEERIVCPHTKLVIDGFQGSANSFATAAFQFSQSQDIKLAHHMHSPSQILQAIEQNIPVWLTIREPEGTILSLTSRWPHISVSQALQSYIAFYRKLEPYSEHYIVSNFTQTTQHLDLVVNKINQRFGSNFDTIDVAKVNKECRPPKNNNKVSKRQNIKQIKKRELIKPKNTALLQEAQILYKKYEKLSNDQ
ncbi:hypothetical protein [Lyngbya sp. PCC 8106]|uniref:hypothetical protein n=1 Tax=Lyngbya sp. (strain PCC 8106) TaxID=313612 RepID=UPI0000EAB228|nr:hypothetical protein [Lyngbya sp. PCC 8106]EAW35727.1 hypothetical protein L8106_28006 [Lyngbya sp. PCC 8106]